MSKNKKQKLEIEEIQTVSLEIFKRVTDFCDSMGLRHVLAYGSLLGAIRHKGFILWDDIVIMMPRPDYDRFLSSFMENKDLMTNLLLLYQKTHQNFPYRITCGDC